MVYIRAKKIKSDQYLYLVKSTWDSKRNTSKQEIVKYLGKASSISKNDIPEEFRNDPKVLSLLASCNPKDIKKREESTKKYLQKLYKKLLEGDLQECVKIYDEYRKNFNSVEFLEKILKPVMYKIGENWKDGKISIAEEHVASNVAQSLVKFIMEQVTSSNTKKKILICVPIGEEHHLGCDVLETFLTVKGFKVFNMVGSVPTEIILEFIKNNNPDVIFVSITLEDNLRAGDRLVKKIKDKFSIPVLIGGYALQSKKIPKFDGEVMKDVELAQIPRIIRKIGGKNG